MQVLPLCNFARGSVARKEWTFNTTHIIIVISLPLLVLSIDSASRREVYIHKVWSKYGHVELSESSDSGICLQ